MWCKSRVKWAPGKMVEVVLGEPDDFKVRETLTRIGVASRKEEDMSILYVLQAGKILSCPLENYLLLMANVQHTINDVNVGIVLLNFLLIGV